MAYTHKNTKGQEYYLHTMQVKLRGSGKMQTIYFFKREVGKGALDEVPDGYKVIEIKRTGLPLLKKK